MTRFYRLLLRLYPASFRVDYQAELTRTYEDKLRERDGIGVTARSLVSDGTARKRTVRSME